MNYFDAGAPEHQEKVREIAAYLNAHPRMLFTTIARHFTKKFGEEISVDIVKHISFSNVFCKGKV